MIKLFKNIGRKGILPAIICILVIAFQVYLDLKIPDYMSKITVLVESEGSKMAEILKIGGKMLICAFGTLLTSIIAGYITANIAATFSFNTRKKLFSKVNNLDVHEVKAFSTSSLITRTTNDITQIEMLIAMGFTLIVRAPITVVWAIKKILNKSWQWSAVTALCVVILLSVILIIILVVIPKFKLIQKLTDKLNEVTRENLTGVKVVRAFNAENYQEEKFDKVNTDLTKTLLFNQRTFALLVPVMYLVMYFLTLSIYAIGAYLIDNSLLANKLTIFGDMIVFSSYAMQIIMSFLMLAMIFMFIPRANVSAKRINEVLDTKVNIKDGKLDGKSAKEEGTVEFKNVSFRYPDAEEYLLKNISFKAEKGETVAIIGSTGSGKSSLINLIPRFYDATEGEVLIDGVNVKDYKKSALYEKLGYVPQKAVLFTGDIIYNTTYGKGKKKASKEAALKALEVAQAKEFIEKMDDGYKSNIAQSGTNISGGQKQRLSIARAIARDPEIYIFDDSFSALDYKTDAKLRKDLKEFTKDATSIIVAQRIGTILNADKIIVLDNGTCVGIGTHKQLLKKCKVYKEIALSQLSKEELENA